MESKETSGTKPWLQFYDEGVPPSLDYPQVPLDRLLAESAAKYKVPSSVKFRSSLPKSAMGKVLRRELTSA